MHPLTTNQWRLLPSLKDSPHKICTSYPSLVNPGSHTLYTEVIQRHALRAQCQAERADRCDELEVQFEYTAPLRGQVLQCDAKVHCNKGSVSRVWQLQIVPTDPDDFGAEGTSPDLYGTLVIPESSLQSDMPAFYQVDRRFSQGNTTNESASNYNAAEGNAMSESWNPGNLQYTPATAVDDFNDSGFFETNIANTIQANYKDWSLFEDELIDVDVNTSGFFADIDASVIAHNGSVSERAESENFKIVESGAATDRQPPDGTKWLPYDPVHQAVEEATQQAVGEAVREAMKQINFGTAGETNNYRNEDLEPSTHIPIETWANTYHRHEYIAYLLEQNSHQLRDFRQFEEGQCTEDCSCGSQ